MSLYSKSLYLTSPFHTFFIKLQFSFILNIINFDLLKNKAKEIKDLYNNVKQLIASAVRIKKGKKKKNVNHDKVSS